MRGGTDRVTKERVWHLLDSHCKSHKLVTRSSFAAETLAAVATEDAMIPLLTTLHEFAMGPLAPREARRLREEGGLAFTSFLTVDSMSLFAAVSATTVRVPSERSLAGHVFWLRELLDRRVLHHLRWCDTRDMSADAHTKGVVPRDAILALMKGFF